MVVLNVADKVHAESKSVRLQIGPQHFTERKANVVFYPESGYIVADLVQSVYFEVLEDTGAPMSFSSMLYYTNAKDARSKSK